MNFKTGQRVGKALRKLNLVPVRRAPFLSRRYRYTGKRRMQRVLGSDFATVTTWQASDNEVAGELGRVFARIGGGHKWVHYLPVYESLLDRSRPVRMLEIGVLRGNSLKLWREYLHPESLIVGIDINPACKQFEDLEKNVHVRIGSQDDLIFLQGLVAEFGPFDVILDDGSHMTSHIINSFRYLFRCGLGETGVYIVEDLHSNYWASHRDSRKSFIDFVATLIDAMHAHYLEAESELHFRTGYPDRVPMVAVPMITPMLESIEIHDSIIAVRKSPRDLPRTIYQ